MPYRPARSLALALALVATAACAGGPAVRGPDNADATLRAQTQALLDAIAVGDKAVWERHLDPQVIYLSEAGEIETRASLLAQLDPLPAGITGSIRLGRFEVRRFGDTAVMLHVDEESVDYHGQPIAARYLSLATWRLGPGGWKLIAMQVLAGLRDPPAINLPADELDAYAGTYRLTDAIVYTIRRDGEHLVGERTGRPPQPLRVEARDVLFVPGQPRSRKIFQRDATGDITGFADRREGRDIAWTRRAP